MKKYLKKSKLLIRLYETFIFLYGAYNWRSNSYTFDKKCPFDGPLGKFGYYLYNLNENQLLLFKNKALQSDFDEPIRLQASDHTWLSDFFDALRPVIVQYLGTAAKLDGMFWYVTEPGAENISSHWHTDNVGTRLKVFVCVEGDGTIPTILLPTTERIPSTAAWIKAIMIELLRWMGISSKFKESKSVSCMHKDGTVYIFDTQLLHRGGFEIGQKKRIIFHLEFSVPNKHKLIKGPLGTSKKNEFTFSEELLELKSFNSLLDPDRVTRCDGTEHFLHYRNPNS